MEIYGQYRGLVTALGFAVSRFRGAAQARKVTRRQVWFIAIPKNNFFSFGLSPNGVDWYAIIFRTSYSICYTLTRRLGVAGWPGQQCRSLPA